MSDIFATWLLQAEFRMFALFKQNKKLKLQ